MKDSYKILEKSSASFVEPWYKNKNKQILLFLQHRLDIYEGQRDIPKSLRIFLFLSDRFDL